ncbi:MAG TPA: hypothetical protein VG347_00815 [Verrucomicrobiae bacterium]|nr:hypothetical protein [Verrucomicrobiae bacterium]
MKRLLQGPPAPWCQRIGCKCLASVVIDDPKSLINGYRMCETHNVGYQTKPIDQRFSQINQRAAGPQKGRWD